MSKFASSLLGLLAAVHLVGCGNMVKTKQENEDAPTRENAVYPMEYANGVFGWRQNSHRVYIAFTDDYNYAEEDMARWSVPNFCSRVKAGTVKASVHLVWSGPVADGKVGPSTDKTATNPYDLTTCAKGTFQAIDSSASSLDLSSITVTQAIGASALVEYISADAKAANSIQIIVKTATADGAATFSVQNPPEATDPSTSDDDIPADPASAAPATSANNLTPSAEFAHIGRNPNRVRINLLGMIDPTTNQPVVLSDATVTVVENGVVQGIKVTQSRTENALPTDIVFVVDNSGSMNEEADGVANGIQAFAEKLSKNGIDAKFGVLGYWGDVRGALNLSDFTTLNDYLNRGKGYERTMGFGGSDSSTLEARAKDFNI